MPSLVAASGPKAGARFEVGLELIIGRSLSCGVPLPADGKVSRRHARLAPKGEGCIVIDLGSRNGTFVNGDKIEGEVGLEPGDRVQIGDTAFLFDPPIRASIDDGAAAPLVTGAVEEFMPAAGDAAIVFRVATALLSCPSEGSALRKGAEEAMRVLGADASAAFLPGDMGLITAAVVGKADVRMPRTLLAAAIERREAARSDHAAVAPLWAGGSAFGALYVERKDEAISAAELGLLGVIGRLCGEAVAAARARTPMQLEDVLVGTSRIFRRTVEQLRRAATSTKTVVISGEGGAGKGLLSQYLHARSSRATGPFIRVDCRVAASHVEEELFGRPAGPGVPPRPSALARADGGTLFLVGAEVLPRTATQKLARLLKAGVSPAQDGGEVACDVRVIAASREGIARMAAVGKFDADLAVVLEGSEIAIPPVRERRTDIPLLFEYFAGRASRALLRKPPELSPEAKEAIQAYPWPGNVRELRLCAERLALLCAGEEVLAAHLPREIQGVSPTSVTEPLGDLVARLEKDVIAQALRKARGKKIKAAAMLGISRPTLDKKIAVYKLLVK